MRRPTHPSAAILAVALLSGAASCIVEPERVPGLQTFRVRVTDVDGADPPTRAEPRTASAGVVERYAVEVTALDERGERFPFDGWVRVNIEPGTVVQALDDDGDRQGRNLRLRNGKASGFVDVTGNYGETYLTVEDLGYVPNSKGVAACANGENDDPDEDPFVDFPNDPGCAFADDDTEEAGSFASGVSQTLFYRFPTVRQAQGGAAATPFEFEGVQVATDDPQYLVVTRISQSGFFVTDLADQGLGHNHLYVFNFSTPPFMRVCDRVTYLAGTMTEFYGYTEMAYPSFDVEPVFEGDPCPVPEPTVLFPPASEEDDPILDDDQKMEAEEGGLVRVLGFTMPERFGPKTARGNQFDADRSNCDFSGDGRINFEDEEEASCNEVCTDDPLCSEWSQWISRGTVKIHSGSRVIQVQTDGASLFEPADHVGQPLAAVTGTLANFSGGDLNWTIETRCQDDLVCELRGCADEIKPPSKACVSVRPTDEDNDEGTN